MLAFKNYDYTLKHKFLIHLKTLIKLSIDNLKYNNKILNLVNTLLVCNFKFLSIELKCFSLI